MVPVLTRVLWHVNRSPLGHVVKTAVAGVHLQQKMERRRLGRELPADAEIVGAAKGLGTNGYAIVDPIIDRSLLTELAADGDRRLSNVDAHTKSSESNWATRKTFWVRLLDEEAKNGFSTDSVFVRYALQPRILSLVTTAFGGELPLLTYVLLTLSGPTDAPLAVSQLWHRDHDNTRVIKMFTYLTDVNDERDGPFTFMPREPSDRIGYSLRSHRPDGEVFRKVPRDVVRVMTAPRLTTFLVETSRCYHMGSRMAPGHRRLMYTATFVKAPAIYPRSAPAFRAANQIDRATQLVLGLT